jgi:uncharacterized protein (DUF1697 family)
MNQRQQYVAFLRAINVGGRVVKMAALREIFESLRFNDVATFIASGNVIFTSTSRDAGKLEKTIERGLQTALGFPVLTFIRTTDEVERIANYQPFRSGIPPGGRMFVGLLRDRPPSNAKRKVSELSTDINEFHLHGRELYWLCAKPSLQSIMSGQILEKTLGGPATLRNVNTFRRLAQRYPSCVI